MDAEVAIIGGSFAGLSAALQLARTRRSIVVVDGGQRRNRFTDHSHGFLGQDGRAPADIIADAKAQLLAYETVRWIDGFVGTAQAVDGGFAIELGDGNSLCARRLVLATGVKDTLPEIEGLTERWGRSVFMCPYCDGYELDRGRIGVLASSEMAMHQALLLPDWGRVTLFTNGAFVPDAEQESMLARRDVTIETRRVDAITGARADIVLEDGVMVSLDGLFVAPKTGPVSDLAEKIGCALEDGPMGPFIATDMFKQTSVPGVFACGDAARAMSSVALAVGDGALAGVAAHRSLIFD